MKIFIGFDHRGDKLAYDLVEKLIELGHEVNLPFESGNEADDYPDISVAVCKQVRKNKSSFGILICGTGIGMCMSANRENGIRAVYARSEEEAYFARRHEDANVLVLSAGYADYLHKVRAPKNAIDIVNIFMNTDFEAGRHINRIKKLDSINKKQEI